MYDEPAFQPQFRLAEAADEAGQPVVRKWQFDLALFILIEHLQQHLHPDLYINLLPDKYRSDLLGYQNLIIFIDELGIIRVYSAASLACIDINYEFLIKNTSQSKILLPYDKGNDVFALKLNLYNHLNKTFYVALVNLFCSFKKLNLKPKLMLYHGGYQGLPRGNFRYIGVIPGL